MSLADLTALMQRLAYAAYRVSRLTSKCIDLRFPVADYQLSLRTAKLKRLLPAHERAS